MSKQKTTALLLVLTLCLSSISFCVFTASAAPPGGISLFYDNASAVSTDLEISGTTATVTVEFDGNSNAKSVKVSYSLQRKSGSSWLKVQSWSGSKTGRQFRAQKEYNSLTVGAEYRVYATFTVTGKDGSTETITDYTSTYTC